MCQFLSVVPDVVEIDTLFSSFGRLVQDIGLDITLIFQMAAAAILDFEVNTSVMALIYKVPVCFPRYHCISDTNISTGSTCRVGPGKSEHPVNVGKSEHLRFPRNQ